MTIGPLNPHRPGNFANVTNSDESGFSCVSKTEKVYENFLTELLDEYGVDTTIKSLSSLYWLDSEGNDLLPDTLTSSQERAVSSMRKLRGSSKTSKVDETWQKYIENVFQITQNDITPLRVERVARVKTFKVRNK
jgi:hypothetical protein